MSASHTTGIHLAVAVDPSGTVPPPPYGYTALTPEGIARIGGLWANSELDALITVLRSTAHDLAVHRERRGFWRDGVKLS